MLDFGFYNMDCMEGMKQFPDQFFDLAICDPPYGINVGQSSMGAGGGVAPHRNRSAANLRGGQMIIGGSKPFGSKSGGAVKRDSIQVGGGLCVSPKSTRHSMTATHRMPSISKNYQEWQRKQSYGAGTIFSTISGQQNV